ncbi:hypothetical protein IFM89_016518 [Coptis chinensis]|uniref:Calcineurin-like phosphoesterase domain-containing protein n=1 Tax=Coptis chinensis TaxID=261450 RepID=A0A835MBN0_9MAGN|nr:hypothetical protein IFM89_016518 [Coptis chinensis]
MDGICTSLFPCFYRHNIQVLQRVVKKWNDHENLKFAINVGDIVYGFRPKPESLNAVQKVVKQFETSYCPIYHMIGNHCLYNLPWKDLLPMLKMPTANDHTYYDFSPTPDYRFVVLDGYDISAIGWSHDHPKTMEALKILQEKNPNSEKNILVGMVGVERRFLMFNGAIGKEQLEWLDKILQVSTKHEEKVVVCCHMALDPGAAGYEALCCNYDEVMEVIHRYKCVKACITGHDHKGGRSIDSHGVHQQVLEAALECPPGSDVFGYIDAYPDKLSLFGTDRMASTEMVFNS